MVNSLVFLRRIIMSVSNEISDSLIQEVAACAEMASQWSDMTAQTGETAADHGLGTEDARAADESLAPSAKCLPEHRIPTAEDDLQGLPLPLRQLISTAGVQLVAAPCGKWNIDGYAAKLCRPLSVTFSIDSIVTSEEVLEAVAGAGVAVEEIASTQYRGSNRPWCVSFTTRVAKDHILERGVIKFGNVSVFFGDFKTVIVKVYEAPPEMPDTVVIGRLSHYGRVLSLSGCGSRHWYFKWRANHADAAVKSNSVVGPNCRRGCVRFLFGSAENVP